MSRQKKSETPDSQRETKSPSNTANQTTASMSSSSLSSTASLNEVKTAVKSNKANLHISADDIKVDQTVGSPLYIATPLPDADHVNRIHSVIQLGQPTIPEIDAPRRFMGESSYRQTVIFLIALAIHRVFPERQMIVQSTYSVTLKRRSYYGRFAKHDCTPEDIETIKKEMEKLKSMEVTIHSKFMENEEAIAHFMKTKQLYSAKLANTLNESRYKVAGVDLNDGKDPFYILQYRHLLSNTKYVHSYGLFHEPHKDEANDFVIAFPNKKDPYEKIIMPKAAKSMRELYLQGVKLGRILGLECVGDMNECVQQGRTKELVLLSEAYHDQQIVNIAQQICNKKIETKGKTKVILISGPSSSGKTTFASKLCIQLKLLGLNPVSMEVDMFYKNRNDPAHPVNEDGSPNFEVIDAVRIDHLQDQLHKLFNGETIHIPNFSFVDGMVHGNGEELKLPENGVLVMEGIFCLNPKLTATIDKDEKVKIFMCPTSFLNLDDHHFMSEQVVRLVRRVSRDHKHRNKQANTTLFKWGQLQGGEDENIFPFVDEADFVFNSTLPYEIPVLKVFSKPLLQTVTPKEDQYKDAKNLIQFFNCFLSMPDSGIPSTSLLMEFIGKSVYDDL